MRKTIITTDWTCYRCKKKAEALTTLFKLNPDSRNYDCGHRAIGDLCDVCNWGFQNFMDGMR